MHHKHSRIFPLHPLREDPSQIVPRSKSSKTADRAALTSKSKMLISYTAVIEDMAFSSFSTPHKP